MSDLPILRWHRGRISADPQSYTMFPNRKHSASVRQVRRRIDGVPGRW